MILKPSFCVKKSHDALMSATNNSAAVAVMTALGVVWLACCGMVSIPDLSACQLSNPRLPGDHLLRVAELEAPCQDIRIAQLPKTRQRRPDLRRHRIIPFAKPAQNQLGLLFEVFEIGHGRIEVDCIVGGLCPFGTRADAPYSSRFTMPHAVALPATE